jgi:phosphatidylserine decarboxylase
MVSQGVHDAKAAEIKLNEAKDKEKAIQCKDSGFIKFGSRVDIFLPLESKIDVEIDQVVKGGLTPIASIA